MINQTYLTKLPRGTQVPLQALQYGCGVLQVGARRVAAAAGCRTPWNAARCIPRLIAVHDFVFAVAQCQVQEGFRRSFHTGRGGREGTATWTWTWYSGSFVVMLECTTSHTGATSSKPFTSFSPCPHDYLAPCYRAVVKSRVVGSHHLLGISFGIVRTQDWNRIALCRALKPAA